MVVGVIGLVAIAAIIFAAVKTASPTPATNIVVTQPTPSDTTPTTTPSTSTSPKPSAQPSAPVAVTGASTSPTDTTVIVSGTALPNGAFTNYWFEYGTSSGLGKTTSKESVGSGYSTTPTPGYITGLVKNTTYYFRLDAENQYGRVNGMTYSFKTTSGTPSPVGTTPVPGTLAASSITRTSANLNGSVIPNNAQTQYWFEYGSTLV